MEIKARHESPNIPKGTKNISHMPQRMYNKFTISQQKNRIADYNEFSMFKVVYLDQYKREYAPIKIKNNERDPSQIDLTLCIRIPKINTKNSIKNQDAAEFPNEHEIIDLDLNEKLWDNTGDGRLYPKMSIYISSVSTYNGATATIKGFIY